MINCIRNGEVPRTDGRSGLAVARVLEAANAALRTGYEVELDGPQIDITTIEAIPTYAQMPTVLDTQATA